MATASYTALSGAPIMHSSIKPRNLSPAELQEVARKVHALRRVTKVSGFFTSHAIVELLKPLSTDDLIAIGEQLKLKPRELPEVKQ